MVDVITVVHGAVRGLSGLTERRGGLVSLRLEGARKSTR